MVVQKDNVANQREHLILLLANVHIRQFPKPDQQPKVCTLILLLLIYTFYIRCGVSLLCKLQFILQLTFSFFFLNSLFFFQLMRFILHYFFFP